MLTSCLLACRLAAVLCSADPDWTPEVFDYDRPLRLRVEEKGEPQDPLPQTRQQEVVFRNLRDEPVPVLITLPPKGKGPFPAVLVVHPLGGDRRQVTRELGKALTEKGFACVALDLPAHGDRKKNDEKLFVPDDPQKTYRHIVGAIKDIRQTLDLIKQRKDLDAEKGVPVVGYSLGAWFGTLAASADRRVPILVLQCGGTAAPPDGNPEEKGPDQGEQTVLQRYPTIRPQVALPEFGPRPLLMQNGKKDPFISEEHARNLYRLAKAPKELKWYDSGHILPEKAAADAAEWIVKNR